MDISVAVLCAVNQSTSVHYADSRSPRSVVSTAAPKKLCILGVSWSLHTSNDYNNCTVIDNFVSPVDNIREIKHSPLRTVPAADFQPKYKAMSFSYWLSEMLALPRYYVVLEKHGYKMERCPIE